MERSFVAGLLSATVLVVMAAPSHAEALSAGPMPQGRSIAPFMARCDGAGNAPVFHPPMDFDRGDRGIRPPRSARGPDAPGFQLAARLAAAETYVGITSAQLDAWRAYTAALIDLLDLPEMKPGPDGSRSGRPDDAPPADVQLLAEELADLAIERSGSAEALKAAIAALRPALTPDQIGRLLEAERVLLPPPGPHGPPGFSGGCPDRPRSEIPLPPAGD